MEFAQVLAAYKKCAKGKRKSLDCARFESRLGKELLGLLTEINQRTYQVGQSRCFVVTKPKPREIWASQFKDRIVHHLIVNQLEKIWEKSFSEKSYACRRNKGAHAAILDLKKQVRRISQGGFKSVWALQVDIESFFVMIDREILRELFSKKAYDPELIWLIEKNFEIDPRSNFKKCGWRENFNLVSPAKSWLSKGLRQGIPIGNLTSQFGANLYLNALDHFIERGVKPQGYLRYMDDLLLLGSSMGQLLGVDQKINHWLLENRKLNLNPHKTTLRPLSDGIDYLGFRIKQVWNPKEPLIVLAQKKKKWDLVKEIRHLSSHNWGEIPIHRELSFVSKSIHRKKLQKVNARLGLLSHSKSYSFCKQTLQKFKKEAKASEYLKIGEHSVGYL